MLLGTSAGWQRIELAERGLTWDSLAAKRTHLGLVVSPSVSGWVCGSRS